MLRCARKMPAAKRAAPAFRIDLIGWQRPHLENASRFCSRLAVSLPPSSSRPTKPASPIPPARLQRRDFALGCGTLIVLGALPGFWPPSHGASALDDFMLVSQTISGVPRDRHAGLSCFSHLHRTDDRFIEHIQTLAWLVRRHPGVDAAALARLLDADNARELRAALVRVVDAWGALRDAEAASADVRALMACASDTDRTGR